MGHRAVCDSPLCQLPDVQGQTVQGKLADGNEWCVLQPVAIRHRLLYTADHNHVLLHARGLQVARELEADEAPQHLVADREPCATKAFARQRARHQTLQLRRAHVLGVYAARGLFLDVEVVRKRVVRIRESLSDFRQHSSLRQQRHQSVYFRRMSSGLLGNR